MAVNFTLSSHLPFLIFLQNESVFLLAPRHIKLWRQGDAGTNEDRWAEGHWQADKLPLKDMPILIPRTCDYAAALRAKKKLSLLTS